MSGALGLSNYDRLPLGGLGSWGTLPEIPLTQKQQANAVAPGSSKQESNQQSQQQSSSGQVFSNPGLVASLSQSLGGVAQEAGQGYNAFVNNPTAHPAFQNSLQGLLAALRPQEQAGQRNLMDMFRGAGNTSSSVFGDAAAGYQSDVQRNQMEVASKLLASMYPQIAGAMFAPMAQTNPLIQALTLQQAQSSGSSSGSSQSLSQAFAPQAGGGRSSGSIGFNGSPQGATNPGSGARGGYTQGTGGMGGGPSAYWNDVTGGGSLGPMATSDYNIDPYGAGSGTMPGGGGSYTPGYDVTPDLSGLADSLE